MIASNQSPTETKGLRATSVIPWRGRRAYLGLAGVIDTGIHGLILGGLYLASGRNLWASILAHGVTDTVALTMIFFNWF
jgi:membrane protease YdiL (CAAX protease family)